jgi:hypothetical protein
MPALQDLADQVAAVLRARPDILEGYIFGSVARGEAQPHSDIDVAVYLAPSSVETPYGIDAEITADLMAALSTNRIDLVVLNHAGPLLYHRVLRDGVRVFSRDLRATTTREGQAMSRYCDYLPHLAKIRRVADLRLKAGRFGQ